MNPITAWNSEHSQPIEIVAPDEYAARGLLDLAAPVFPAEIVSGSEWTIRLLPLTGGGWMLELLSLVERWLESTPLPCATVRWGGRSYLIRASADAGQPGAQAKSAGGGGSADA